MGRYSFTVHVDATPEQTFALWTNLDRMAEWVGGVTHVSDVTGPLTEAGTRYTTWFGKMSSATEVLEVQPGRLFRTRFGNRILRGENSATFEPDGGGTKLTQVLTTTGLIPAVAARIFATGSYKGSFRGELNEFARICSAEGAATSLS